jgi:GNAT superfamily N-acetyltransferase
LISIREARPGDAAAIADLLADIGHPVSPQDVPMRLEAFAAGPGKVFVAEDGSGVLGVVTVNRLALLHRDTPVAFLNALVVRADHRGRGVGRALVDAVQSQARDWGCATVELTSRDDRHGAHQFYVRLGFSTRSRKFVRAVAG